MSEIISFPEDYCIIDLETTGLSPKDNVIIEVSAIRIRSRSMVDSFSYLVCPDDYRMLEKFIVDLTGITDEMLADAPHFDEIGADLQDFLGNDILVGQNITFDLKFLAASGLELNNNYIDTLTLSRKLLPALSSHKLSALADYFDINTDGAHRAQADCIITHQVFDMLYAAMLEQYGSLENFQNSVVSASAAKPARKQTQTSKKTFICKLCGNSVPSKFFLPEIELCADCASVVQRKVNIFEQEIPKLLEKANKADDPDLKIYYLKTVLEYLYDYKISFYNKGIDVITEDIQSLIDDVLDGISYARL